MREVTSLQELESLRDQFRVLLIFAPTEIAGPAATQEEWLAAHSNQLAERDVELLFVSNVDGAHTVRERYEVPSGSFAVVLLGKDGQVKMRSAHPVPVDRLCAIIDTMPMRQAEMRRQF